MDYRDRMMNGQRVGDYYAEQSARSLQEINQRQRRAEQRSRNGGYTDGEMFLGLIVALFRKLPKTVRRVLLTVIVLVVAWLFLGEAIVGALRK